MARKSSKSQYVRSAEAEAAEKKALKESENAKVNEAIKNFGKRRRRKPAE